MDILTTSNITMNEWKEIPDKIKDYIKRLENKIIELELYANDKVIERQAH